MLSSESEKYKGDIMVFSQLDYGLQGAKGINSTIKLRVPISPSIEEEIERDTKEAIFYKMKFIINSGYLYTREAVFDAKKALEEAKKNSLLDGNLLGIENIEQPDGTVISFVTMASPTRSISHYEQDVEEPIDTKKQIYEELQKSIEGRNNDLIKANLINKDVKYRTTTEAEKYNASRANIYENANLENIHTDVFVVKIISKKGILEAIENEKKDMIHRIGDIEYTNINNDPCKFSAIVVSEPNGNEGRGRTVTLFQEYVVNQKASFKGDKHNISFSGVNDDTKDSFDIIRGDKVDRVEVSLSNLVTNKCRGIGLSKGKLHTDYNNIFDIDEQAKVMGLIENTTYFKDYPNSRVLLDLRYNYNKQYDNRLTQVLGFVYSTYQSLKESEWVDTLWVARYLFGMLKRGKDISQLYYVPISTCGYQKQIARIRVFPDVKWWFNIQYNPTTDHKQAYVKKSPKYHTMSFTNKKEKDDGKKTIREEKYEFDFEAFYSVNGTDYKLTLGEDFEMFKTIRFFFAIFNMIRKLTYSDEAKGVREYIMKKEKRKEILEKDLEEELRKKSGYHESLTSMVARRETKTTRGLPISITVSNPSFSAGVFCEYAYSKKHPNLVGQQLLLNLNAKPLLLVKGRLDLLYFAQFIGPVGQVIKRIQDLTEKVSLVTFGAVRIDFYLDLFMECKIEATLNGLTYHSIDGLSIPMNRLENSAESSLIANVSLALESGFNLEISIKSVGELEASGEAKGTAELEINFIEDKKKGKPSGIQFLGLKAEINLTFKKRKDQGSKEIEEPEDKDEKDEFTMKGEVTIIDKQEPWKIDFGL